MTPTADPRLMRAWFVVAAVVALPVATVQAYNLIVPLSYWPATSASGNVVYEVNLVAAPPNIPNPPLLDGSASWNAAFVAQLDAWNTVLPDGVLHLAGNVGSGAAAAGGDGKNDVVFASTIYGDSWGSSTVGICLAYWSGNRRTEADVLFNSTKTWNAYTGNLQGSTTEFRRVALHELGHALLLDHPDDAGQSVTAIMNSQSSNTDALATDDRAGVLAVFGGLVPATLTVQPRQFVTTAGGQFLLNVTATGSEPLTYQWQRSTNNGSSWSDLGGFDFPNGSASGYPDGNLFRVVVTNPVGPVTSRPVLLSASGAAAGPAFAVDPASVTIDERGDAILAVHATGSRMPTYQWEYSANGGGTWGPMFSSFGPTDAIGTNGATLKLTQVILQMNGYQFRCVATNPSGSATSAIATLTVNAGGPAPYFTWHPLDVTTSAGLTTLVPAGVSGTPGPSLQWQASTDGGTVWNDVANGATYSGATTATLSITSPVIGQSGTLFRLRATNASGTATSRSALLSVRAAEGVPVILDPPDDTSAPADGVAMFSARVDALPAAVHQWEYSPDGVTYTALTDGLFEVGTNMLDTLVHGAHTRTLALAGLDASLDGFRFRLVARNEEGGATSAAATLTIGSGDTMPAITAHPSDATVTYLVDPTFTVTASGAPAPAIRGPRATHGGGGWYDLADDATFSGATTTTLTLTNPTVAMSTHRFRAVATNSVGSANSNAALLTVNPAPVTVTLGDLARTYTGAPIAPSVTTSPVVPGVQLTYDGSGTAPTTVGSYAVVATVTEANYTGSANGTLTIAPAITPGQTGTVTTTAGAATTLSVTASTGTGTAFQWQIQNPTTMAWADIDGATAATHIIPSTQSFFAGNYRVVVTFAGVSGISAVVTVAVQDPAATDARLLNLSTRALCQTGASIVIPGFVISGTGTKKILIRGVGPRLTDLGVVGALPDPVLTLKRDIGGGASETLFTNDDWGTNANSAEIITVSAQVFAFPLLDGSKDAALLVDLPAGSYTVPTAGVNDTTGVSLVELYDADPGTPTARLINISNRGYVGVGGQIMIPGFVVSNVGSRTFLIRAVGPRLAGFGVPDVLLDPELLVYFRDSMGVDHLILSNDDWGVGADAARTATVAGQVFAFPLDDGSKDAAFVVTLPPGSYTVNARGKNDSTGVALVEVYLVP